MTTLLTPAQAAERVHVCEKTLRKLRREGLIRYVAITDRKIMYRPEDCQDFIDRRSRFDDAPPVPRHRGKRQAPPSRNNVVPLLGFTARQNRAR